MDKLSHLNAAEAPKIQLETVLIKQANDTIPTKIIVIKLNGLEA